MKKDNIYEYTDIIKMVLSRVNNIVHYQCFVLVIFILYFLLLIIYVYTKPKNYYKDISSFLLKD